MLHLLRESSIDKALESYKDPENIPGDNIDFARKKGPGIYEDAQRCLPVIMEIPVLFL